MFQASNTRAARPPKSAPRLTDAEFEIVVALAGQGDAARTCPRDPRAHGNWAARWAAGKDYESRGLPWVGGGGSDGDRKAASLALARLEAAALIRTFKGSSGQKTARVRLTPKGDATARALLGGPSPAEIRDLCRKLRGMRRHPLAEATDSETGWISEAAFVDHPGEPTPAELDAVERSLLPAIVRGVIESACTTRPELLYRMTPAGLSLARSRRELPPAAGLPNPTPAFREFLQNVYEQELKAQVARLQTLPAPGGELGPCPMPDLTVNGSPSDAEFEADFWRQSDLAGAIGDEEASEAAFWRWKGMFAEAVARRIMPPSFLAHATPKTGPGPAELQAEADIAAMSDEELSRLRNLFKPNSAPAGQPG